MCESPVICDLDIINKAADDPFHGSSQQRIYRQSSIVVFIVISPKWGLFGIINQIYHASVGILMKCLPSGGWFSLGLRPRENHSPSGRHFIGIPTLAWHICILTISLLYVYIVDHLIVVCVHCWPSHCWMSHCRPPHCWAADDCWCVCLQDCCLVLFHPYQPLTQYAADMGQEKEILPLLNVTLLTVSLYKYDISVGLPTWLSTPSENCHPRA